MRRVIRELDPDQPVPTAETWQHAYGTFMSVMRLGMAIFGSLGVLGLLLALAGLYGLVMFEVNSRTREIGIRMALGARQGAVVRLVISHAIILAACGVAAGVGLNYGAAKLIVAFFGNNAGSGPGDGQPQTPAPNDGTQINVHAGSETFGDHGFVALVLRFS